MYDIQTNWTKLIAEPSDSPRCRKRRLIEDENDHDDEHEDPNFGVSGLKNVDAVRNFLLAAAILIDFASCQNRK